MKRALVVDDLKANLYLLEVLLKGHGYDVQSASNGAEALALAQQNTPDVIISDILMPVMDGFTFCTHCKNDPVLKNVLFIFYTATYTEAKDEAFALSLGADAFFIKPIEPMALIQKINEAVANHAPKKEEKVPENEPQQPVNLKEYNEILIHKLEQKMAQLDETNKELQESESRFRRLAEKSPALIYRISLPEKQVTYINPVAGELTGHFPDNFYKNPSLIFDYLLPASWEKNLEESIRQILSGELLPYFEYLIQHKNGSTRWVQLRLVLVKDENAQINALEGILIDQTENQLAKLALLESEARFRNLSANLEKRVQERTAQLEATNKELDAFSYSVSHDLQAPLRALDGISKMLLEDYGEQLDETGQLYLNRICSASQHMKHLIDDLLKLSKISRSELNSSQVNLSSLVEKIKNTLEETHPERQVHWEITPDALVNGDRRLLEVALSNLVNNAFKFTSKTPNALIQFNAVPDNGQTVYSIRDNGVGFDMEYAGKLFGAFQRLHSSEQFEGTGIGLTIVQRIINRHGGRIWAEAAVDQGAAFYFTLGE
jgi:PAS domain S-box-containing protein